MGRKALCTAHGKRHFQLRKAMGPAFAPEAVSLYVPRMVEIAEMLCAKWAEAGPLKGQAAFKDFTFQVTHPSAHPDYLMFVLNITYTCSCSTCYATGSRDCTAASRQSHVQCGMCHPQMVACFSA